MSEAINFFDPFFVILITSGLSFVIMGIIQSKWPPRKINNIYGYRTPASKRSKERWDFAQKNNASQLRLFGFGMIVLSFGGWFLPFSEIAGIVTSLLLVILFVVLMIFETEKSIKRKFDS